MPILKKDGLIENAEFQFVLLFSSLFYDRTQKKCLFNWFWGILYFIEEEMKVQTVSPLFLNAEIFNKIEELQTTGS